MDVEKLMKALENDKNEKIMNFTTHKMREMNYKILEELDLTEECIDDYMMKLEGYKYADEIDELSVGAYIKWIPLHSENPNPLLKKGAIICEIKITEKGIFIVCKNFLHHNFQFKMDDCLIFQKLKDQERVLLSALDHLSK